MLLPADIDISEHSRKFYDGTYTLVKEGFTDEAGVYREFDCTNPVARAPTPLPPRFDYDEEQEEWCGGAVQEVKPGARFTAESSAALPDELFLGHADRDRLIGRFEGIRLVDKRLRTETSVEECYRLCGLEGPGERRGTVGEVSKPEIPTEESPHVRHATEAVFKTPQKATQAPTESPLSECPTDLSQWSAERKITPVKSPLSDCPTDLSQWSAERRGNPVTPTKVVKLKYATPSARRTPSKARSTPVETTPTPTQATPTPPKAASSRFRHITTSTRSIPASTRSTTASTKETPTRGEAQKIIKPKKKATATAWAAPTPDLISVLEDEKGRRRSGRMANISK